jgi:hypothetical protein
VTPEEAIEIVAQQVIFSASADDGMVMWENYPEIGEDDWYAVLAQIALLAVPPRRDHYRDAYALLESRAES